MVFFNSTRASILRRCHIPNRRNFVGASLIYSARPRRSADIKRFLRFGIRGITMISRSCFYLERFALLLGRRKRRRNCLAAPGGRKDRKEKKREEQHAIDVIVDR